MVSLDGNTYRIERLASRTYGVVRVTDDVSVGTFKTGREIRVFPEGIDPILLETIARDAVMSAKTSWVDHPVPTPRPAKPAAESATEKVEPPVSSRRGWVPA
jgi:hypothetical protein